jgi:hypothetical protein
VLEINGPPCCKNGYKYTYGGVYAITYWWVAGRDDHKKHEEHHRDIHKAGVAWINSFEVNVCKPKCYGDVMDQAEVVGILWIDLNNAQYDWDQYESTIDTPKQKAEDQKELNKLKTDYAKALKK